MFALVESPQQKEHDLIKNLTNLRNANLTASQRFHHLLAVCSVVFEIVVFPVAVLTVLLWDWLISIDREIKHFWRARWTLGTLLYFANRIVPALASVLHITTTVVSWSPEAQQRMCKPTLISLSVLAALSFSIVQIIMSLRTYALYDCNKPLLAILVFLSVANMVNQVFWVTYPNVHNVVNTLPAPYNGCLIVGVTHYPTWARYIPLLVFEALLLVLTFYKFVIFVRSGSKAMVPKVLFRDGFIGFVAVILATVFGIVIVIMKPQPLLTLGQVLAPIVPVLIASNMLLNLRDVMRISSTVMISSSGTAALVNKKSHTRTIISPSIVPGYKSGPGKGTGPTPHDPLHSYDVDKGPLAASSSPGTKGMEWSYSARTMTTGVREESMPIFSKVVPGLYDELPADFASHQASNKGGNIAQPTPPSSEWAYYAYDPYAYGAFDSGDDDNDELPDENRHYRKHIPYLVPTRQVVEDIELGERTPMPMRADESPAPQRLPHPGERMVPAVQTQGDILGEPDAGQGGQGPHSHARMGPPGRDDQESDGDSVLIID